MATKDSTRTKNFCFSFFLSFSFPFLSFSSLFLPLLLVTSFRSGKRSSARKGVTSLYLVLRVVRVRGTRRTKKEVERQHQGMDRPGFRQVQKGSGEQEKMDLWCPNDPRS